MLIPVQTRGELICASEGQKLHPSYQVSWYHVLCKVERNKHWSNGEEGIYILYKFQFSHSPPRFTTNSAPFFQSLQTDNFYLLVVTEYIYYNRPNQSYTCVITRYSRACGFYQDFIDRGLLLTRKLLNHGFLLAKLKPSLRKFYCHHHYLVDRYGIYMSPMIPDMFHLSYALIGPFLIHD